MILSAIEALGETMVPTEKGTPGRSTYGPRCRELVAHGAE